MFKSGTILKYFLCMCLGTIFGIIEGSGGRLAISEDGFAYSSDNDQNNADVTKSSATLGFAVPLVSTSGAIYADINRLTADDLIIDYKILGDLSQVAKAIIEIRDDLGKVVFTQEVPVKPEGKVVWPAGQPMDPTPNNIYFQVKNPDGMRSGFVQMNFGEAPRNILDGELKPRGKQRLPGAPELLALEPSQLPSSLTPSDTWITLRGVNFVEGDTVVVTNALPSKVRTTEFVSENEIRALVPGFWLRGPDYISVHVESARDPDLASGKLALEVLNTVNIKLPPPPPKRPIIRVVNNDGYLQQPPSGTTGNIPVSINGINFDPGSTVEAIIGNRTHEFAPYEVSETTLTFYLPAELIRVRAFRTSMLLIPGSDFKRAD